MMRLNRGGHMAKVITARKHADVQKLTAERTALLP